MGIIGIGAVVATGIIAVAAGAVSGPVAFPVVIDAIKWLVLGYLGAQGGQDAVTALKGKAAPNDTQIPSLVAPCAKVDGSKPLNQID